MFESFTQGNERGRV